MSKQYRGKSVETNEWVYGWLVDVSAANDRESAIRIVKQHTNGISYHPVIPESVGQSTGEVDCNKALIYDKDWVRASIYGYEEPQTLQVCWRRGGYVIDYEDSESDCVLLGEFVGSIELTDNPELLQEQKK